MSVEQSTTIPEGFKRCRDCGEVKPLSEFWKDRTSQQGRMSRCAICASTHQGRKPKALKPKAEYLPDIKAIGIPLSRGFIAIIDPIDSDLTEYPWLTWGKPGNFYVKCRIPAGPDQRQLLNLHRMVMSRALGRELNPSEKVDHINGDTFDNRRANLRVATSSQNSWNQKLHADSTSGFKGVNYVTRKKKWKATISVHGNRIHLGFFDALEDAVAARQQATIKYHGPFGRLR